jgi:FMN-dependent oxidoreductase (nitrilotriacetate monooxygenase family)
MTDRKMHLMAFLLAGPTSHHHGMWRHPETENAFLDPASYEHVARVLEQGCFDSLFFADILAFYDFLGGSHDTLIGRGGQMGLLDPLPLLAVMARVTRHIGLGATISTSFFNTFHLARSLATLDMISGGRVAWNVVTSALDQEARNFGMTGLPGKDERYDRAEEVLEACCALWDSWEPDALKLDKQAGIFADPSKVRPVNYAGKWISTRGPNTVPRTPQGRPVIMQAGSSPRGREFSARWAELIFCSQATKEDSREFRDDMRARLDAVGRDPDGCAVLPSVTVVIGETESIAREKAAYLDSLTDPELVMASSSALLGVDLSAIESADQAEAVAGNQGIAGSRDRMSQVARAQGISFAQAVRKPRGLIAGTPKMIADVLEDWFTAGACDGFVLPWAVFPGTYEDFARMVTPELQRRGLLRTEYAGRTLRENIQNPG